MEDSKRMQDYAYLDNFRDYKRFILTRNRKPINVKEDTLYTRTTWYSVDEVIKAQKQYPDSEIALVITKSSGLFLIDLDDCILAGKHWTPRALEICSMFPGCYQETSRSQTGFHIIGTRPEIILPSHHNKVNFLGIEFYMHNRLVFLTGFGATGSPKVIGQNLAVFLSRFLSKETSHNTMQLLLEKMLNTKTPSSTLGYKASFKDLWTANIEVLGKTFPDAKGRPFDWSEADMSLCGHLAFWTGKDIQKMDNLFRKSALMREKWERDSYREPTLQKAIDNCRYTYGGNEVFDYPPGTLFDKELIQKIFDGIVYDTKDNNFYLPNGNIMSHTGFKCGPHAKYTYVINSGKGKRAQVTGDAVKAFTNNKLFTFPKVHGVIFRPQESDWRIIKDEKGNKKFNIYRKPDISPIQGSVDWFHDYLERMCSSEKDREIIKAYCISMVQNPGIKFQWCLGLQGAQGIGKGALADLLEYIIGPEYSHRLRAVNLNPNKSFNGWMYRRLLVEVSEFEKCNPELTFIQMRDYITGRRVDLEMKNKNPQMIENTVNFIITTNKKESLAPLWRERRIAPISLNIQTKGEREQAGLTSPYWVKFYKRIEPKYGRPALAISNLYYWMLAATPDEKYDPLGKECRGMAPETDFLEEAKEISRSAIAQQVLDLIEANNTPGFKGGVVFLSAFDRIGFGYLKIGERKRILEELDYRTHPKFPKRFSFNVKEEKNTRPIVCVYKNSSLINIKDRRTFQECCLKLQEYK